MPRDIFPFEADREIIAHFLAGKHKKSSAHLTITDGTLALSMSSVGNPVVVAWYDTAGALCSRIPSGYDSMYTAAVVEEILGQLGMDRRMLVRDVVMEQAAANRHFAWFFDGAPVNIDQPFVICGPLGARAHRLGRSKKRKK